MVLVAMFSPIEPEGGHFVHTWICFGRSVGTECPPTAANGPSPNGKGACEGPEYALAD
jgi:hypothetical protein